MILTKIETLNDVREFVRILMEEENLNFHPDTPFYDYINYATRQPAYTPEEIAHRQDLLQQCFNLSDALGVDTHEYMCDVGNEILWQTEEMEEEK